MATAAAAAPAVTAVTAVTAANEGTSLPVADVRGGSRPPTSTEEDAKKIAAKVFDVAHSSSGETPTLLKRLITPITFLWECIVSTITNIFKAIFTAICRKPTKIAKPATPHAAATYTNKKIEQAYINLQICNLKRTRSVAEKIKRAFEKMINRNKKGDTLSEAELAALRNVKVIALSFLGETMPKTPAEFEALFTDEKLEPVFTLFTQAGDEVQNQILDQVAQTLGMEKDAIEDLKTNILADFDQFKAHARNIYDALGVLLQEPANKIRESVRRSHGDKGVATLEVNARRAADIEEYGDGNSDEANRNATGTFAAFQTGIESKSANDGAGGGGGGGGGGSDGDSDSDV